VTKGDIDGLLQAEENEAKRLAEKYHVKYLDLGSFELNRELVSIFSS